MNILDRGSIELLDSMGSDLDIVNAARTSFDGGSIYHARWCAAVSSSNLDCSCEASGDKYNDGSGALLPRDAGLINFLLKNSHGTPFEMVEFKFAVKAPIFVFREWHRHRIASINEMSGRYVELEREFYVPHRDDIREQKGKPGAYYYQRINDDRKAEAAGIAIDLACRYSFDTYERMLSAGIAKEVARLVLPVNTYSKMVWKTNLRALMNFLSLRNHEHAQIEIRRYAEAIEEIITPIVPVAMAAFNEHGRKTP